MSQDYTLGRHVALEPAAAREAVIEALKTEGFGIISEIDMQAAFDKKLGVAFRPYVILGACKPQLAHDALQMEPNLGALLPCNVVVQEADGGSHVAIIRPTSLFGMFDNDAMGSIAADVEAAMERVLDELG